MTWKIYIDSIQEAELESGKPSQIIIALFKAAGYNNKKEDGISEAAADSWYSSRRKCKVYSYFPDGKLGRPEGVYKFFRNRPSDKLKELQNKFREKKDSSSPIDCETKDMDRFCWSLVNQFLDILEFQRLDMLPEDSADNIEDDISVDADQSLTTLPIKDIQLKPITGSLSRDLSNFLIKKSLEDIKMNLNL